VSFVSLNIRFGPHERFEAFLQKALEDLIVVGDIKTEMVQSLAEGFEELSVMRFSLKGLDQLQLNIAPLRLSNSELEGREFFHKPGFVRTPVVDSERTNSEKRRIVVHRLIHFPYHYADLADRRKTQCCLEFIDS